MSLGFYTMHTTPYLLDLFCPSHPVHPTTKLTHPPTSFLQISGMVVGSMIEADNRLRAHEWSVRQQRKSLRDAEVWRRYEEEFGPQLADKAVGRGVDGPEERAWQASRGRYEK